MATREFRLIVSTTMVPVKKTTRKKRSTKKSNSKSKSHARKQALITPKGKKKGVRKSIKPPVRRTKRKRKMAEEGKKADHAVEVRTVVNVVQETNFTPVYNQAAPQYTTTGPDGKKVMWNPSPQQAAMVQQLAALAWEKKHADDAAAANKSTTSEPPKNPATTGGGVNPNASPAAPAGSEKKSS